MMAFKAAASQPDLCHRGSPTSHTKGFSHCKLRSHPLALQLPESVNHPSSLALSFRQVTVPRHHVLVRQASPAHLPLAPTSQAASSHSLHSQHKYLGGVEQASCSAPGPVLHEQHKHQGRAELVQLPGQALVCHRSPYLPPLHSQCSDFERCCHGLKLLKRLALHLSAELPS